MEFSGQPKRCAVSAAPRVFRPSRTGRGARCRSAPAEARQLPSPRWHPVGQAFRCTPAMPAASPRGPEKPHPGEIVLQGKAVASLPGTPRTPRRRCGTDLWPALCRQTAGITSCQGLAVRPQHQSRAGQQLRACPSVSGAAVSVMRCPTACARSVARLPANPDGLCRQRTRAVRR